MATSRLQHALSRIKYLKTSNPDEGKRYANVLRASLSPVDPDTPANSISAERITQEHDLELEVCEEAGLIVTLTISRSFINDYLGAIPQLSKSMVSRGLGRIKYEKTFGRPVSVMLAGEKKETFVYTYGEVIHFAKKVRRCVTAVKSDKQIEEILNSDIVSYSWPKDS